MKRAAESQLTRDTQDSEDEPPNQENGHKKADPDELDKRPMRPLPKRSTAPPTYSSFAPPAAAPLPPPNVNPGSVLLSASKVSSESSFQPGPSFQFKPTFTSTIAPQTGTAKLLSSFLNGGATPSSSDAKSSDYYASIRGLNKSYVNALAKALEDDPFIDLTEFNQRYKSLREDLETKSIAVAGHPQLQSLTPPPQIGPTSVTSMPSQSLNQDTFKKPKTPPPVSTPPASTSVFSFSGMGGSGSNPFGPPTSAFTFTSPSSTAPVTPPKPISFGSFGGTKTPGGSIGNPVGFSFGEPENKEAKSSTATDGPGFALSNNPNDEEGQGEEDEETTHAVKAQLFQMGSDGEGKKQWKDMGTGILRLKKHKNTGARRMLLRNSGTGKIAINFNLYAGMNPVLEKRTIRFTGFEGAEPRSYNVRIKTEEQARDLSQALSREIEFVRAKDEDAS